MKFTARETRLLGFIEERECSRMELGQLVGALNIPHHVMMLRKKGIDVKMKTKAIKDIDNNVTHPGFYYLEEREKENVRVLLGLTAINPDNGFQNNLAKHTEPSNSIILGESV